MALIGTEAHLIEVEFHIDQGIPRLTTVGLAARSASEAEQRVRSALGSSGERWPRARMTANLAPGALRKEGAHFDLALALAALATGGRIPLDALEGWVVIGELALDGSVRPVRGAVATAIACRRAGRRGVVCPAANASEAALVDGIEVVGVSRVGDAIGFFDGSFVPAPAAPPVRRPPGPAPDLREVRGHYGAKRAVEIAAAGGHNLLLIGPPGSGKTMLAARLPGILPVMSMDECLDVTRIHSVAGLLDADHPIIERRPFRAPHHNVSVAGLIGGGSNVARPGEVSLAHHGVLFLDELSLYRRDALEAMRAPLEDGVVRIARSGGAITYPCEFSVVAAMNPCPCGYNGDPANRCTCSESQLANHRSRLSGPLLDRFDIQADMTRLSKHELLRGPDGEPSERVRARVEAARAIQVRRYGDARTTNASARRNEIMRAVDLSGAALALLEDAIDNMSLSGRGLDRVRRLARTIADLEGSEDVRDDHVAEALSHRAVGDWIEVAA